MNPNNILINRNDLKNLLLVILILILGVGVTNNFDYKAYSMSYSNLIETNFEKGYRFIENFFYSKGVHFNLFKAIIIGTSIFIILKLSNRYLPKKSKYIYYIIFMIYPLSFFAYSLRTTIATAFLYIGIILLIEKVRFSNLLFILLIYLASLFHISIVFFGIYLIIPILTKFINNRKDILTFNLVFTVIISLMIILSLNEVLLQYFIDLIWGLLSGIFNISSAKEDYITISGNYGYLLFVISNVLFFITFIIIKNYILKYKYTELDKLESNKKKYIFIEYAYLISLILFFLAPLLKVNTEFSRIYKIIFPIFISASILGVSIMKRCKERTIVKILIVITTVYCFIIYVLPYFHDILLPMITDNWIFTKLK
ncbi:EpsG family protein [Acholeplasma laidlawii]|uniref:EpsG family protein n=1 Tax=Acholeplasma laidlawii TaxID=2148 RepID=UPI00084C170E|nr:EpsG family protein [Acholeplasma laidlawii]OED59287.1 hypothetical protein BHS12_04495 [Acholeplasma laidlawii]